MVRLLATLRLAVGLALIGLIVLITSHLMGSDADANSNHVQGRTALTESLRQYVSAGIDRDDLGAVKRGLATLVRGHVDLQSIGLRKDGRIVLDVGEHSQQWRESQTDSRQVSVPIGAEAEPWGTLEVRFADQSNLWSLLADPRFHRSVWALIVCTVLFAIYLQKMLNHLDPTTVIPRRVRAALDTFAEGLLVLDLQSRIVLANKAFSQSLDQSAEELQGQLVTDLPWIPGEAGLPWNEVLKDGKARTGQMVDLSVANQRTITYMVNASPIRSDRRELQGVLASFDDVTLHEQRKLELENTLRVLGESREKIRKQNAELRLLATRDPLTGCMNRRSFFEAIEKVWACPGATSDKVACIMLDVDHFKLVNDRYGHGVGDEVLECVGETLTELETRGALACRYGGEEFCVTIEGHDEDQARDFADEIRRVLNTRRPCDVRVTASFGVAVGTIASEAFQDVLERADQSLYFAKNNGRNQVVCWTEAQAKVSALNGAEALPPVALAPLSGIPFHAVTALISALSYRDASTAEHSRRVADLCVLLGGKMMSAREQYVLETAALLHDIGKIGTPDSVLLKPGPLDHDERAVMSHHDMIGLEIIKTTFDNRDLLKIVANHFAWFGGHPSTPGLPVGDQIPLGARILAICDTFDAIVSDRVYRKGTTSDDAVAELRRCSGTQFDPDLVELFADTIKQADRVATKYAEGVDVSKEAAFKIGLLMEGMAQALEKGDVHEIHEHAKLLSLAATDSKLAEMSAIADELEHLAEDGELEDLIHIATTLLDLCRVTQRAYLDVGEDSRRLREGLATKLFTRDHET